MNSCLQGNSGLWILIILLILGIYGNVFSSNFFTGCGWPFLAALAYCLGKNGTLSSVFGRGTGGCGCNG